MTSQITIAKAEEKPAVNAFWGGYQAGAWNDLSRDWFDADFSGWNLSEDQRFSDSVRRIVLQRIRHEVRNNPYLAGMATKFPELVGIGTLRCRTSDEAYNRETEKKWNAYIQSCGSDGSSLDRMQIICMTELFIAGEYFKVRMADGSIKMIPSENCANPSLQQPNSRIVNGIERNSNGKPIRYYFGAVDQFGGINFDDEANKGVAAEFVTHVYMRDRIAMGRGLSMAIASICTARDLQEIVAGKTRQIKDANAFSGTIEKVGAEDYLRAMALQQNNHQDFVNATVTAPPLAPMTSNRVLNLAPGTYMALEPGEKLNTIVSNYQATDYKELIMLMLHAMSTPVGMPVELWFSGLGDVNYSGFKGLGTQWDGRRKHIIQMIEDEDLEPMFLAWCQAEREAGNLPENPDGDDMKHRWVWKPTGVLDDEKKTKAAQLRIETGLTSIQDEWEMDGRFAEDVLIQRTQFWKQVCIAAGKPETPPPISFLLYNKLPEPADAVPIATPATTEVGTAEQAGAAASGEIQSTALNGAQVTALVELAAKVQLGELPKESAKAVAKAAFPLISDKILSDLFDGITPQPVKTQ